MKLPFEKCLSGTQNDRVEVRKGEFSRAIEPEKNYPLVTSMYLLLSFFIGGCFFTPGCVFTGLSDLVLVR